MDINEAKEQLNKMPQILEIKHLGGDEAIETVLNELDKKEKIINEMAKEINEAYFEENDYWIWFEKNICTVQEKEDYSYLEPIIIDYFTKKVEGE